MNKSILLKSTIIAAITLSITLPAMSYVPTAKAVIMRLPGPSVNVGQGGIDIGAGGHSIHADKCTGVRIGSGGQLMAAQLACRAK